MATWPQTLDLEMVQAQHVQALLAVWPELKDAVTVSLHVLALLVWVSHLGIASHSERVPPVTPL